MADDTKQIAFKVAVRKVNNLFLEQIKSQRKINELLNSSIEELKQNLSTGSEFKGKLEQIESQQLELSTIFSKEIDQLDKKLKVYADTLNTYKESSLKKDNLVNKGIVSTRKFIIKTINSIKSDNDLKIKQINSEINELNEVIENYLINTDADIASVNGVLLDLVKKIDDFNSKLNGLQDSLISRINEVKESVNTDVDKQFVYDAISEYISQIQIVRSSNGESAIVAVTSFITLNDTPNTYFGQSGKLPKVNSEENRLEFDTIDNIAVNTFLKLDGSNSPLTGKLQINVPTTTSEALVLKTTDDNTTKNLLEVQNSAGTALTAVGANGNVGIGTTSPSAKLDILGSSDQVQQSITANATQTANIFEVLDHLGNDKFNFAFDSGTPTFKIGGAQEDSKLLMSRSGSNIPVTFSARGDSLFLSNINFFRVNGILQANSYRSSKILSPNSIPWILEAESVNGGTRFSRVGFGVADFINRNTPKRPLDEYYVTFFGGLTNDHGNVAFQADSGQTADIITFLDSANNKLGVITADGDYGIGTASPSSKLHVAGDIEVSNSANGVILESPNGTRYRTTVDNTGTLITTSI